MLERVYRDHRQGLYTLALSVTRCPGRAEDAVQEAFARLWSRGAAPSGDPVAYVFASVRNAAIDQVRRHPPDHPRETVSIYNGLPTDPALNAVTEEQHRAVREAIEALPDAQRESIVMKIYGGLTFRQMAEALGEPLPTVAARYRRALEVLSRQIPGAQEVRHA